MGKDVGDNRCSNWGGNPYSVGGCRKEYKDLPDGRKDLIKALSHRIADEMWENLQGKTVLKEAEGKQIPIQFDREGVRHVARDALIVLSGKYMSKESMVHIDHIIANSIYIPTKHKLKHSRDDDRLMWFKYKDNEGRGIYFSVSHSPAREKPYTLYSVSDNPPKVK